MHTILHVDASNTFRTILSKLFEEAGFRYLGVSGVNEARAILESDHDIRLILTALELDGIQGEDFVRWLNESSWKEIPVVVISSHDTIENRQKMFSLGAVDYLPKSAGVDHLLEHVRTLYVERLRQDEDIHRALQNMKIAVLDDSRTELGLIRSLFELHEIHNVSYYSSGTDLLQSPGTHSLYLIDLILPDYSGEQIILKLKEKHRDSLVVAISSIDHYKTISNVLLAGADDYIIKPFNTSIFMARMKAAARSWMMLEELKRSQAQLAESNHRLQDMVVRDSMTGLLNHRYIIDRLEGEIRLAARYGRSLSILMIDIDHFKNINDQFGHQVGDIVLMAVADEISRSFRDVDIKGRYGGEEFLIILPETEASQASISAQRLQENLASLEIPGVDHRLTVSGGIAEAVPDDTATKMIDRADHLLYQAKESGRNRIFIPE